jgi:glycosyltransferase involved in cell wall biosynthesis
MSKRGAGRILYVVGSLELGGAERQLGMLAERLKTRGWIVDVMPLEKSGALVEQFERAGIRVGDGGYRSAGGTNIGKLVSLGLCEVRLIWRVLRTRPDVVHGFLPLANLMSAVAGRAGFIRLVMISKRSLGIYQDHYPKMKRLDRIANAISHVITANSRAVAEDTQARDGYEASRIVVIPNGLDFTLIDDALHHRDETRGELRLSQTDIAIAMVANLIPYKGHLELIEAFARIAGDDSRFKLFLIGEDRGIGPNLLTTARKLGVADRMKLLGLRHDVPKLLSAMDIGVMASHEEGFSNALLEKLAAGLPVVATSVGGNPEALEGMPNCILVRPRDPNDLARGMASLLDQLGAADNSRETRRRLVRERYSVDAMVDAYEHLYRRSQRKAIE